MTNNKDLEKIICIGERFIQKGRIKRIRLGGHFVRVIIPQKPMTIEEGIREVRKLLRGHK